MKGASMNNLSNRPVLILVGIASVTVILFGIRAAAYIVNPILLAAVITITILPLPSRLTKRGFPNWLALVSSILMVVVVLVLVILTVFFSINKLSNELPEYMDSAAQQTGAENIPTTSGSETSTDTTEPFPQISEIIQGALRGIINMLVQFGLALVIFIFMISAVISWPKPSRLGFDPNSPSIGRVSALTDDVRKYMTILTLVNFLVGLGNTIFLMILGVDFAVLWGLLAWFMGYIPSIGFIIALIPPVLLAYAQYGLETALIVLVGYILINGGVQNFIQPKIMGQGLKIAPVIVFIGLFVWGFLLGGIGAILAVPLTALILVIIENIEGIRPLAMILRYTGGDDKEDHQKTMEQT
jgi:predicted PurR-regulated permease PerM